MAQPDLPQVLLLKPLRRFQSQFSQKFQFLKAWESQLPLDTFLSTHAQDVQAMVIPGAGLRITADEVLSHLPSLRLIVTSSAGVNHIDLPECCRRGISVANAGTVFSEDVADMAVGGKRIGIVGLGSIGYEVAKRLDAFGCRISYNSREQKPSTPYQFYSNVCELAASSDALIICCALTDENHHMINSEVLLALGKDGIIIAGAGLDVFEHEPNVPKELYSMDNVVLTPHVAVFTNESIRDVFELMAGNLEAFSSNKPLLTPVIDD
ncbi:D-isomer specific 2-hydroxyacid dehydrogenase, NAD-binding domain [Dillenia turbinata]|uniref:D-isomer specific 2-hydroxyacid dehydrogenase, NAD-binding domain n=1 Tax=Dillenia turbinata TaxID=194707 RepID=A0AAN8UW38_9MAGN